MSEETELDDEDPYHPNIEITIHWEKLEQYGSVHYLHIIDDAMLDCGIGVKERQDFIDEWVHTGSRTKAIQVFKKWVTIHEQP
jgi:hypothetical protein